MALLWAWIRVCVFLWAARGWEKVRCTLHTKGHSLAIVLLLPKSCIASPYHKSILVSAHILNPSLQSQPPHPTLSWIQRTPFRMGTRGRRTQRKWFLGICSSQQPGMARLVDPESFKSRSCSLYLEMTVKPFLGIRVLVFDLSVSSHVSGV